jgi:hypothetical protein
VVTTAYWAEARTEAANRTYERLRGHLATITSAEENEFVTALLEDLRAGGCSGDVFIGGLQPEGSPEPDGDWQWVTGEPWDYARGWSEPDEGFFQFLEEDKLAMNCFGEWNDSEVPGYPPNAYGYIVEYEADVVMESSFRRGDSNGDRNVDISDAISALAFLFLGGIPPVCPDAADANDDGTVDISDSIGILNHLFLGGLPPRVPFPDCGADPTIDGLGCGPEFCPESRPSTLVGYWQLNGDGEDRAGGNTLTAEGNVSFVAGRLNQAADVDGTVSSTLRAPGRSAYDVVAAGFTVESFVRVESLVGANPRIIRVGPPRHLEDEVWELYICNESCSQGTVEFVVVHRRAVAADLQSNRAVTDGQWHHVAVTYDGSVLKLYVDGVLDNSLSQTGIQANVGSGTMTLGRNIDPSDQLDGQIDEVRMWNEARTQAEIQHTMDTAL